jgi:hypothetical protein
MPFDGTGNFIRLPLPDFPAIGGEPIYASQFNNVINDLIGGFASVVARDGQTSMTGNISYGGFKMTSLGIGTAVGEALTWNQANAQLTSLNITSSLPLVMNMDPNAVAVTGISTNPNDYFTFDSKRVSHYGITWKNTGYTGGTGAAALISGFGGLSVFSMGYERLRMDGGGNFCFAAPDSPQGSESGALFTLRAAGNGPKLVLSNKWSTGVDHAHGAILFDAYRDVASPSYVAGIWSGGSTAAGNSGNLIFGTMQNASAAFPTERMKLDTSGNLQLYGSMSVGGALTVLGGLYGTITNATNAANVPWTGVSGRPTNLSQFVMDININEVDVNSWNGRQGDVVLTAPDVTTALGFMPLSGINSSMISAALGYAPLSSITGSMVTAALGYGPFNATGLRVALDPGDTVAGIPIGGIVAGEVSGPNWLLRSALDWLFVDASNTIKLVGLTGPDKIINTGAYRLISRISGNYSLLIRLG